MIKTIMLELKGNDTIDAFDTRVNKAIDNGWALNEQYFVSMHSDRLFAIAEMSKALDTKSVNKAIGIYVD